MSAAVGATPLALLAGALHEELDVATDRLVARIEAEEERYARHDLVGGDDLRRSCREHLDHLLSELARPGSTTLDPPRATGRRRAEQGFPLPALLHAYRLGGGLVWDLLVEQARLLGRPAAEDLLATAAEVWALVDEYSQAVTAAYQDEVGSRTRRHAQERAALLDALLDGREPNPADVAEALRLPRGTPLVVVVAEAPGPGQEGVPGAERLLRAEGLRSAWSAGIDAQRGLVALEEPAQLDRARETLAGAARARVGLSPRVERMDDASWAAQAARTASACLPPGTAGLRAYDEALLQALVVCAPVPARRLAHTVLGPLLALEPADRGTLLDTVEAWVATGRSTARAAERLFCHRNTVGYRLRRVAELTGRSLDDPRGLTEVLLAAEALRLLPDDG